MGRRLIAMWIAAGFLVFVGLDVRAETQRVITIDAHDPVDSIEIEELVDLKGKGKKFSGTGTLVLTDGRRYLVEVKQKHNAKKLKSTFTLKWALLTMCCVRMESGRTQAPTLSWAEGRRDGLCGTSTRSPCC